MSKAKFLLGLANKPLIKDVVARPGVQVFRACSSWVPKDKVTHTGQQWDECDYRLARFIDRPKHVNKNFAYELIAKTPVKKCTNRVVWCDGGDPHTGHPKVYINLDKPGDHSCGYCGQRFEKVDDHH